METFPNSKLSGPLLSLYKKFAEKFPGMTEDDFLELRSNALSVASSSPHTFTEVNGQLMDTPPNPDEIKELKDTQTDHE